MLTYFNNSSRIDTNHPLKLFDFGINSGFFLAPRLLSIIQHKHSNKKAHTLKSFLNGGGYFGGQHFGWAGYWNFRQPVLKGINNYLISN